MWSNLLCSSGCVLRTSISLPLFLGSLDACFLFSRTVYEKSQNRFSVKTVYLVHPNEWRKNDPILKLLILTHCKKPTFSKKVFFWHAYILSTLFTITYLFKGFKVILHTSDEGGAKCTSENWLEEGRRFYIYVLVVCI